jgi:hypothetical protein
MTANPSIEQTVSGMLRMPLTAAHVELQGLPPLSSKNESRRAAQRLDSFLTSSSSSYRITAQQRIALISRAKVRTDKLQPVIDAASSAADPDERRTRGPHSLAAVAACSAALN